TETTQSLLSEIRVRAKKYSSQAEMKANTAAAAMPGAASGMAMRMMEPSGPQPSISAASSSSGGTASKADFISQAATGRVQAMLARMSPASPFNRPSSRNRMKYG